MKSDQEFIPKVRGMKNNDNTITTGLLEDMHPLLPIEEIKECMISGLNKRSEGILR